MSEKLTTPLTERRSIWDNEYGFQANRTWLLRVRRHADGVYATNFQNGQTAVPCWTPERISRRSQTWRPTPHGGRA